MPLVGVGAVVVAFLIFARGVLANGANLAKFSFWGLLFTVNIYLFYN
jgi:hypothetical protein